MNDDARDWIQATAGRSGGSSRRESRRAGRVQRGEGKKCLAPVSGHVAPVKASEAALPTGPMDVEVGSPESPQGAEFRHGPVVADGAEPLRTGEAG